MGPRLIPVVVNALPPAKPVIGDYADIAAPTAGVTLYDGIAYESTGSPPTVPRTLIVVDDKIELPAGVTRAYYEPDKVTYFESVFTSG